VRSAIQIPRVEGGGDGKRKILWGDLHDEINAYFHAMADMFPRVRQTNFANGMAVKQTRRELSRENSLRERLPEIES